MKYIEDLRDIYEGEEIWVIGAGASLDKYPLKFFEDKVCIGMNWVFSVFKPIGDRFGKFRTRAFYSVHQAFPPVDWIARNLPDLLQNCFFMLPPDEYRSALCVPEACSRHSVWWEDYDESLGIHYMRWGIRGGDYVSATRQDFADVAQAIVEGRACEYVSAGTTMHWAVQAAAVLGARKIHLVGCEGKGPYAEKHGSMYAGKKGYGSGPHWAQGTRDLIGAFARHGIIVVHHTYRRGKRG